MKNFSFRRYGMILRRDLVNQWSKLLNATLGMALGLFLLENILLPRPQDALPDVYSIDMFSSCMTMVIFVISFYLLYGGTTVLADMRTKQDRISALMLPGTNLEKFLSRLTRSLVVFFLLAVVAFIMADCARMLLSLLLHHVASASLLPYAWQSLGEYVSSADGSISPQSVIACIAIWLANISMATLGGVIFRRNPFIMSGICFFVFLFLFGLVVGNINYNGLHAIKTMAENLPDWTLSAFCLAFAFGIFCLSYWLFCRLQVVNPKFLNL